MPEIVDIERYLAISAKIDTQDLDWEAAQRAGLTESEHFILTYFADIEGQTIVYLRDLLHTKGALEPEVVAFLSMWNYEEYFHGRALTKLLEVCGQPLGPSRIAQVRKKSGLTEKVNAWGSALISKFLPRHFLALFMSWGAINELTTLRGYERLEASTHNPILAELCRRIAKQERRHFAWYFNNAEQRLSSSESIQRFTRFMLGHFWTPVGAGVKPMSEVTHLFLSLFPGELGENLAKDIDERISTLPGLTGLSLLHHFNQRAARQRQVTAAHVPVLQR